MICFIEIRYKVHDNQYNFKKHKKHNNNFQPRKISSSQGLKYEWHIYHFAKDCGNSIIDAMELPQSGPEPPISSKIAWPYRLGSILGPTLPSWKAIKSMLIFALCNMFGRPISPMIFWMEDFFLFLFHFVLITIIWSLQNFAHGTTAELWWHVQKFVMIPWSIFKLQS